MSNYYQKQDAKVNIAHALMAQGWNVFGYKPNESDSMTDYYSPADWDGIAEKNGYVLCVDNKYIAGYSGKAHYKYSYNTDTQKSLEIQEKISLLQNMTVEKGCTPSEAETASNRIIVLQEKLQEEQEKTENSKVIDYTYPTFQANPKGSIWHLEKDGIIIDKGRSLTKYADMPYYWDYEEKQLRSNYSWRENKLTDEEQQQVNEFYKFIDKLEKIVGMKIGEGEDATVMLQAIMLITNYEVKSFAVDAVMDFVVDFKSAITDNVKNRLAATLNFLDQAFPEKHKFLRKINLPMVLQIAYNSHDKISPEEFKTWYDTFASEYKTGIGYGEFCGAGNVKKDKVEGRVKYMNEGFEKFLSNKERK